VGEQYSIHCSGTTHRVTLSRRGVRFLDCRDAYETLDRKEMLLAMGGTIRLTACEEIALWVRVGIVVSYASYSPECVQILRCMEAVREARRLRDWDGEVKAIFHDP
jgi:hypothetical protein